MENQPLFLSNHEPDDLYFKHKDLAHSLNPVEEMVLTSLLSGASYGARIVDTIVKESDGCIGYEKLAKVYKILYKLQENNLIEYSHHDQAGGEKRNSHRRSYYKITPTGVSTLRYLVLFRSRLGQSVQESIVGNSTV